MQGASERGGVVDVVAPGRLHIGFIDLHGGLGRRFGSLGLAIDAPEVRLSLRHSDTTRVSGPDAARGQRYLAAACTKLGLGGAYALEIESVLPVHAGFGSGTQLALAIAAALSRLVGVTFDPARMSGDLERGARSGIGIAAFAEGGFVVDGGKSDRAEAAAAAPPIVSRLPFPDDWRLLLVLDEAQDGVHGAAEVAAFRSLPVFPAGDAAHLCRLVLVQMLPALAEADLGRFGAAVTELQARLGDHFAPAQGGGRFTSAAVGASVEAAIAAGAAGGGQSSWGPTGFVLYGSQAAADEGLARLALNNRNVGGLKFRLVRGRNHGASINWRPAG